MFAYLYYSSFGVFYRRINVFYTAPSLAPLYRMVDTKNYIIFISIKCSTYGSEIQILWVANNISTCDQMLQTVSR